MIASDLPESSRRLGTALDLEPAQREAWFATLAEPHRQPVPRLHEMLAEHASPGQPRFVAGGPRLGGGTAHAPAAHPGDAMGPYRLVREIGGGGQPRSSASSASAACWLGQRRLGTGALLRGSHAKTPWFDAKTFPARLE